MLWFITLSLIAAEQLLHRGLRQSFCQLPSVVVHAYVLARSDRDVLFSRSSQLTSNSTANILNKFAEKN